MRLLQRCILHGVAGFMLLLLHNLGSAQALSTAGDTVAGTLTSSGSDTMGNLMSRWSEAFKRAHPAVNVQIQAAGSSTAPPALIQGTADLGPMSRPMQATELAAFESRYGYPPIALPVALDALAIYVHRDNPVDHLSLQQLDAIFSANRRCGASSALHRWGQLGLSGSWVNRPVQSFGRNSASGTYGFFKSHALCRGDFHGGVNEQPGSASVVQAVAISLRAIGYSGVGYATSSVRAIPVMPGEDAAAVNATAENVVSGAYPLGRILYVYINWPPGSELPRLLKEFLRTVYSEAGQRIVGINGYIPLPAESLERVRVQLDLR